MSAARRGTGERQPRVSLARALSKLGYCSRSEARRLVQGGGVRVNGTAQANPDYRVDMDRDLIEVEGARLRAAERVYLMLNKPAGVVTTASDERGRRTVYDCLGGADLPWVGPVGRLDLASAGLLLLTNDTRWADRILDPERHVDKTYHVVVDRALEDGEVRRLVEGIEDAGELLAARSVRALREDEAGAWLEIVLDEGKNRQIRRMLDGVGADVRRLVRVAIGSVRLGDLPDGAYRHLSADEVAALSR